MVPTKKLNPGDIFTILNVIRLPGRVTTGETAALLGFEEHDIARLVSAKLLLPLGKPAANAPKYFASVEVLQCASDREWLGKATRALANY